MQKILEKYIPQIPTRKSALNRTTCCMDGTTRSRSITDCTGVMGGYKIGTYGLALDLVRDQRCSMFAYPHVKQTQHRQKNTMTLYATKDAENGRKYTNDRNRRNSRWHHGQVFPSM